jgi:DNA-directed RNA polymerase subunit RPC12/RpoP
VSESDQTVSFQAPAGFVLVKSALDGISVYAPKPEETQAPALTTYTCPQCGAATRFDVTAGGVACEHCGYVAPARSEVVGRQAQEFEFTLDTLKQANQGWGVARREMHCDNCGADLAIAEEALTNTCAFCGSNKVNVRVAPADALRPRFLIPFKITLAETRQRASEWLGKGWFHPQELSSAAVVDHFTGIYLPFWTFGASIRAHWEAEVGYEHTERYYDAGAKTWRTRVEIRWRWENGDAGLSMDNLLEPGSKHVSQHILEQIYPFNLDELTAYSPDFLAGWQAQTYSIPLQQAWEQTKAVMRDKAKETCYHQIPSSHVRNFSMTANFDDEAWRYALLPVYLAAYTFENKTYQVMVNGQSGGVAGQKPVAWLKVWLAIAALLAPGVIAGLVGLATLAVGVGVIPLMLGAVFLVIGIIVAVGIYRKAQDSEAA